MEFSFTTIHTIDLELEETIKRDVPETFSTFAYNLFDYIDKNKSTRLYREISSNTEVISSVLQIASSYSNEIFYEKSETIANRLLREEIRVQNEVKNMNTKVRKGSCIQAFSSNSSNFVYLITKVQHQPFIDDIDLLSKTGFPQEQKGIWKSCLMFIDKKNMKLEQIKVYSDNIAKYWGDGFLELAPINTDDDNTKNSFKAIDATINRILKKYPQDKRTLRNNIITYIRNNDLINYDDMVDDCVSRVDTESVDQKVIDKLRDELQSLPEKKGFDRQFTPIPKSITAKIRKVYQVSQGIELRVNNVEGNLYEKIVSTQNTAGKKILQIAVDDDATYQEFLPKQ